jgi:hypothetical protein
VDYTVSLLPYQDSNFEDINFLDVSTEFQGRVSWTLAPWAVTASGSFIKELNRNFKPLNDLTTGRGSIEVTYQP